MPKSPNCAQMVTVSGESKTSSSETKDLYLSGFKGAVKDELKELEQSYINNTLLSWAKRYRMVYYCHGSQIEHLLQ